MTTFTTDTAMVGRCSQIITEEFCDALNFVLIDAWLFRRCTKNNERIENYHNHGDALRMEWYNGISSVDQRIALAAFSNFSSLHLNSDFICFKHYKNQFLKEMTYAKMDSINNTIDSNFCRFLSECLVPYMQQDKIDNFLRDLAEDFLELMLDTDPTGIILNFANPANLIDAVRVIEKAKHIFVKYYFGAFPYLDSYNGLYTTNEKYTVPNLLKEGKTLLDDVLQSHTIETIEGKDHKDMIGCMQLTADVKGMSDKLGVGDEGFRVHFEQAVLTFACFSPLMEKYMEVRDNPKGDYLRHALLALAIENQNCGGKQRHDRTFSVNNKTIQE